MMKFTVPKITRENLSRARSYLRRSEIIRSLESICAGIGEILNSKLMGQARYEVEVLVYEYINELNKHPEIIKFFQKRKIYATPFIRYQRGEERELLDRLESVLHGMKEEQHVKQAARVEKKISKKEELLQKGKTLMQAKDYPRGKGVLRRVVEGWGHEEGLITEIAMLFLEHQLYLEAVVLFENVIEQFPSDSKAYGGAVRCYKELHEFERCEQVYLKALKQFGAHPKTLFNMAELYKRWRKLDQAYDYAKRAVTADPYMAEAKVLMEEIEARIF
ncbi:tetratricopeptide repeat protein [Desulfovibrio subterraneus]|uniref:Tetratricopeptide repeat protein n=1 Tax=Desulfovibrio subterraneus TaxID=2718620 RepID=A0A7J0BKI7_9BACT|nr:hypothetical protein [Desulfovibrio subterraneus]GFM33645.1 hypothetical protein DSM101010T_20100 [Desulfovibrio subterraneus]